MILPFFYGRGSQHMTLMTFFCSFLFQFLPTDFEQSMGHQSTSDMFMDVPSNELPNVPKKQKRKKSKSDSSPKSSSSLVRSSRTTKSKATTYNNLEAPPNQLLVEMVRDYELIQSLSIVNGEQERFLNTHLLMGYSRAQECKSEKFEHYLCRFRNRACFCKLDGGGARDVQIKKEDVDCLVYEDANFCFKHNKHAERWMVLLIQMIGLLTLAKQG